MSSTPANIAADEVKDPLPSVVDVDMGRRVRNGEQNKDTNNDNNSSTNMNDHTRDHMISMAKNMASMMDMMKSMQGEISRLSKKCDGMEKALQQKTNNDSMPTSPKKQNTNIISRLDSVEKSMQKTHTKCTQMEKSIKTIDKSINTIQKKQNSMHSYIKTRFYDMDMHLSLWKRG